MPASRTLARVVSLSRVGVRKKRSNGSRARICPRFRRFTLQAINRPEARPAPRCGESALRCRVPDMVRSGTELVRVVMVEVSGESGRRIWASMGPPLRTGSPPGGLARGTMLRASLVCHPPRPCRRHPGHARNPLCLALSSRSGRAPLHWARPDGLSDGGRPTTSMFCRFGRRPRAESCLVFPAHRPAVQQVCQPLPVLG